jgi:hypothetical protein
MSGLFGVGSLCFAAGSLPLVFDNLAPATVAGIFFAGSLAFTAAAAVQLRVAAVADPARGSRPRWSGRSLDWRASAIQFVGTLLFNVSTYSATVAGLDAKAEKHLIWAPDLYGSVCFLVSSALAWREVRATAPRPHHRLPRTIALANLVGSVAFGAAAIGGRYLRTDGDVANIALVNAGTFLGAVCFLVGAALLPAESAEEAATVGDGAAPPSAPSATGGPTPPGGAPPDR